MGQCATVTIRIRKIRRHPIDDACLDVIEILGHIQDIERNRRNDLGLVALG